MARPRIFISSTFYDLKQVRSDIERVIRELGYEPVRHETGAVPYSKGERLDRNFQFGFRFHYRTSRPFLKTSKFLL